jgi:hypothetical protein
MDGPSLGKYTDHIDDQRRKWCYEKRLDVVRSATEEIGPHVKGTPRVLEYWQSADPPAADGRRCTSFQLRQLAGLVSGQKGKDHCGVFCLACLKAADLAPNVRWTLGSGFCRGLLPETKDPKPGDVFIGPAPAWHHGLVERRYKVGDRWWLASIEANTPDVKRRDVPEPAGLVYYSIEPLLLEALDG